ncbi:hypothetical protein TNCV_3285971 [Trichonephila clavipes]|nr:hypothetical protein TNCV_3285971 [Trichonephila clavipes]
MYEKLSFKCQGFGRAGLRRRVQALGPLPCVGVDSNRTSGRRNFFSHFFRFRNLNVRGKVCQTSSMAERFNALRSVPAVYFVRRLGGRGSRVVCMGIGSWLALVTEFDPSTAKDHTVAGAAMHVKSVES